MIIKITHLDGKDVLITSIRCSEYTISHGVLNVIGQDWDLKYNTLRRADADLCNPDWVPTMNLRQFSLANVFSIEVVSVSDGNNIAYKTDEARTYVFERKK